MPGLPIPAFQGAPVVCIPSVLCTVAGEVAGLTKLAGASALAMKLAARMSLIFGGSPLIALAGPTERVGYPIGKFEGGGRFEPGILEGGKFSTPTADDCPIPTPCGSAFEAEPDCPLLFGALYVYSGTSGALVQFPIVRSIITLPNSLWNLYCRKL